MNTELFERHEIKKENGQYQVILYVKNFNEEFGSDLDTVVKKDKKSLKEAALYYVQKNISKKVKIATVVVISGAIILGSYSTNKAEAHEANFNMSYLYFGNTSSYISQVDKTMGNLNLVSPSYFDINTDGSLKISAQFDPYFINEMHKRNIKVVPFLSNHWDRNVGRAALQNREKLSQQIAEFINKNNLDGIQVDIENVTDIDRDAYTDLVRLLREKLPSNKEVSVAVAANPSGWTKGWHGSYDYKALAKYSNYLMIMAYDESYPGSTQGPVASYPWVERSIQYTINQGVPAEKIVLGIPFYGRFWKEGSTYGGDGISNKRVDELLAKYGGVVTFDEKSKSPKATITIKDTDPLTVIAGKTLTPGTYHIWFENNQSIQPKINLVHKYNIKGTGSWSLGQENPVLWTDYRKWMMTHDSLPNGTTTVEQPKIVEPTQESIAYPTYMVQPGDSLWKIAAENKVTVDQLKQYNYLTSDSILIGQVLYLVPPPTQLDPSIPKPTNEAVVVPKPTAPFVNEPIVNKAQIAKSPATKSYPTLKYNSKGTAVKDLQTKLKKIGIYTKTINGTYDTTTKQAVINFQKKYKLKADGVAGPATQSKLESVAASYKGPTKATVKYTTLKYGSKGTVVKDLQNKLKKIGIYTKTANGTYDNSTKQAVINFQKKYKLKADGIAGSSTQSKLDSVATSYKAPQKATVKYTPLKYGSKGTAVTNLQNKLKKIGLYKKSVNGKYDTATKQSVIAFQKKYKLTADGMAGPATQAKLDSVLK